MYTYVYRGFNGILEMDGFKDTFSSLYEPTNNSQSQLSPGETNATTLDASNHTQGCSSGNGAGSASLIVRNTILVPSLPSLSSCGWPFVMGVEEGKGSGVTCIIYTCATPQIVLVVSI